MLPWPPQRRPGRCSPAALPARKRRLRSASVLIVWSAASGTVAWARSSWPGMNGWGGGWPSSASARTSACLPHSASGSAAWHGLPRIGATPEARCLSSGPRHRNFVSLPPLKRAFGVLSSVVHHCQETQLEQFQPVLSSLHACNPINSASVLPILRGWMFELVADSGQTLGSVNTKSTKSIPKSSRVLFECLESGRNLSRDIQALEEAANELVCSHTLESLKRCKHFKRNLTKRNSGLVRSAGRVRKAITPPSPRTGQSSQTLPT